jgi:hypothetical protein
MLLLPQFLIKMPHSLPLLLCYLERVVTLALSKFNKKEGGMKRGRGKQRKKMRKKKLMFAFLLTFSEFSQALTSISKKYKK